MTSKQFYNGYGATGENQSPQLSWTNAPAGTQSFGITMHDPDAPTDAGLWHWLVFNIPPDVSELPTGAGDPRRGLLPAGAIQSITDLGIPGYAGPAPRPGQVQGYRLTVYALSKQLPLDATAMPGNVALQLRDAALARATLVVYGQRPAQ